MQKQATAQMLYAICLSGQSLKRGSSVSSLKEAFLQQYQNTIPSEAFTIMEKLEEAKNHKNVSVKNYDFDTASTERENEKRYKKELYCQIVGIPLEKWSEEEYSWRHLESHWEVFILFLKELA